MLLASERKIKKDLSSYKSEVRILNKEVQKSDAISLEYSKFNTLCKKCLDLFNKVQVDLHDAKIKRNLGEEITHSLKLDCYKAASSLLEKVESDVDNNLYILLFNHKKTQNFAGLIQAFKKYCDNFEEKFDLELESERELKSNSKAVQAIKRNLADG